MNPHGNMDLSWLLATAVVLVVASVCTSVVGVIQLASYRRKMAMPYELASYRKRNGSTVYVQESEDGFVYIVGQVDRSDIIEWEMEFDTKVAAFRKFQEEQERDA